MTATIAYQGNLRCEAVHAQSGSPIETDAPTDNRGQGARFSPTDLVCTALATCLLTTMAIKATDMGVELKGSTANVKKHMASDPRRISQIDLHVSLQSAEPLDDKTKTILERVGEACPVMRSLHPELVVNLVYQWA